MQELNIIWNIEKRKVADLTDFEKNPRKITTTQYEDLKQRIIKYGLHDVCKIDTNNVILSGHMRRRVLQEIGIDEVDVKVPNRELTQDEREEVVIASNREWGQFDYDILANEWELDSLIKDRGFDKSELAFVGKAEEDGFDEKEELGKIINPVAQYGDVCQLGPHRLMCGDSTKEEDVAIVMGGGLAQLIFTDPPYNVDYHSPAGNTYASEKFGGTGGAIFNDKKSDEDCLAFYVDVLKNLHKFSTEDASIYWWFANKNNHINRHAFIQSEWQMSQVLIWLKNSMIFSAGQDYHRMYEPVMFGWKKGNKHYSTKKIANYKDVFHLDVNDFSEILDVWYQKRDNTQEYIHPTQKPVRLAERGIKKNSRQGDIVVDLFNGSGSTMMAAHQLGRVYRGMELDPKYVDVAILRWEKFTGEKAQKVL